jgi:hypothetical protein
MHQLTVSNNVQCGVLLRGPQRLLHIFGAGKHSQNTTSQYQQTQLGAALLHQRRNIMQGYATELKYSSPEFAALANTIS